MDISKYIRLSLVLLLIITFYSCDNSNREFVKNEIQIWDWDCNSIPKKIVLLEYEKSDGKFLKNHKNDYLKIQYDNLNKKNIY